MRVIWRGISILAAGILPTATGAQVTHGNKPDLPKPFATRSAGNGPDEVKRPEGFLPTAPAGFRVNVYAEGFKTPRWLIVAPNGDLFVAESGAGRIEVLRDPKVTGGAQERESFANGLRYPFGIIFHDDYVYVGNTNEIVRFKYDPKTSKRMGEVEHLLAVLPDGSLVVSDDGPGILYRVSYGK